jgi:ABC-type multidrug transport system ATPase subunit
VSPHLIIKSFCVYRVSTRKTTLLDVLAGRANSGTIDGHVFLNGERQSGVGLPRCRGNLVRAAYVLQQDAHNGALTVREILTYAAMLRMKISYLSSAASSVRVERAVADVVQLLSLGSVLDRVVGNPGKLNISGGELRLVTIAVEIIDNPSLIFLDG